METHDRFSNGVKQIISVLFPVASTILIYCFFYYVYEQFSLYDWKQPFTKLLCFASICILITAIYNAGKSRFPVNSRSVAAIEILFGILALGWISSTYLPTYFDDIKHPPRFDIGYTTQNSALLLFQTGRNPYASENINSRQELKPEYRGFHYGPGMLLGYAASAVNTVAGYKIASLVFLLATTVILILLLDDCIKENATTWSRLGSAIIITTLFILPETLWFEILRQGANDIFPVFLLLSTLLLAKRNYWLSAGLFLGFSFATKFSPAIFLLVLFIRKDISPRFFLGFLIGSLPLVLFSLWDFEGLMNNVFLLRFNLNYDSTSLYSITPPALHYLFTLIQVLAVIYVVRWNFNRPLDFDRLVIEFLILLVIIEVTYKEIHANHLIWFFPLFAFLATRYRHYLIDAFAGIFGLRIPKNI